MICLCLPLQWEVTNFSPELKQLMLSRMGLLLREKGSKQVCREVGRFEDSGIDKAYALDCSWFLDGAASLLFSRK